MLLPSLVRMQCLPLADLQFSQRQLWKVPASHLLRHVVSGRARRFGKRMAGIFRTEKYAANRLLPEYAPKRRYPPVTFQLVS
jgi:hypothetical protein